MKIRSRKTWIAMAAVLALAGAGLVYFVHIRPRQAVARYKAGLTARGEKLTVAELIPPPVSRSENSAPIIQRAQVSVRGGTSLLDTNRPEAMRMVAPGKAIADWQRPYIVDLSSRQPVTNDWAEMAAALALEQESLAALHDVIEHPNADWQLDYSLGFYMPLPHLAPTRQTAQQLHVAAQLELRNQNPAQALKHLRAILALVKTSRDERLIVSQLVRISMAQIAFAATWSALQSPELSDGHLSQLQQDWTELEFTLAMQHAMEMERALSCMTIDRMRNSSAEFRKVSAGFGGFGGGVGPAVGDDWMERAGVIVSQGWDATRHKARESAWRVSWSLTDELTALKGIQAILDTTRAARSNGCYLPAIITQRARLVELGITNKPDPDMSLFGDDPDVRTLFTGSLVGLSKTLDKVMAAETARQMALAGIALRRFLLKHGHYPDQLGDLTPELLRTPLRDPVDGKVLRYRATGRNAFTLYSIGQDGVDDGGDATNPKKAGSLLWQKGHDWVWPQAASEEEITEYFATQTKKSGR